MDSSESAVIEFIRTVVRHEQREVGHGRLWMEMRYWDKEGNIVEKPEALAKWYESLCRWIKKRVPRREYLIDGHPYKDYISPEIEELLRKGYKLM